MRHFATTPTIGVQTEPMEEWVFDNVMLPIPCEDCGQETEKPIRWIKANDHLICPGCGVHITLEREKLLASLKRMEEALKAFSRK